MTLFFSKIVDYNRFGRSLGLSAKAILFQESEKKKGFKGKLALMGYFFFGVGITFFSLGIILSIFNVFNFGPSPDPTDELTVFLNTMIPWIMAAVIFFILAPVLFSFGTEKEQKILPKNQAFN